MIFGVKNINFTTIINYIKEYNVDIKENYEKFKNIFKISPYCNIEDYSESGG